MKKPEIVGIVNITDDSFSDGGKYLDPDHAIVHALQLHQDGAAAIDLGAASSHPDSSEVTTAEEIKRIDVVIDELLVRNICVSIDTFNPDVQKFAIQKGIHYLNDIQGFPFPEVYPFLTDSDCRLIVMHSIQRRGPATRITSNPDSILSEITQFFEERLHNLENGGVHKNRIIIDPGMGFFLGSDPDSSFVVLQNLRNIKEYFNLPIMISVSRKSFLGSLTGSEIGDRGASTLSAEIYCAHQGIDYIRTHDVRALHESLLVQTRLTQSK